MDEIELDEYRKHDLIRPFRQDILHDLESGGYIESLFAFPSPRKRNQVTRVSKLPVTFPFAIWEAKRASEGDAVAQNALQVQMILEWQQRLAEQAGIAWVPLVFHFVSAGSEWKVYACHIQTSKRKTENICVR